MADPVAVGITSKVKTMSPSKISTFEQCPKKFELSYIHGVREPSGEAQVRGTLVHAALEALFKAEPSERSEDLAFEELERYWYEEMAGDPDHQQAVAAIGEDAFLEAASKNLANYFGIEPIDQVRRVAVEGVERNVSVELTGLVEQDPELKVTLRGIIDRLDREADGSLTVVDYKTGKAPSPRFAEGKMPQLYLYAAMVKAMTGELPARAKLYFLGQGATVVEAVVTAEKNNEQRRRANRTWKAVVDAFTATREGRSDAFEAKPSKLCDWCYFSKPEFMEAHPYLRCPKYPGA